MTAGSPGLGAAYFQSYDHHFNAIVAKCSCKEACLPWYCLVDTTGANDFGRMRLDCVHTRCLLSGKVLMRMSDFVPLIHWSMF
jgi:hypothetical protein